MTDIEVAVIAMNSRKLKPAELRAWLDRKPPPRTASEPVPVSDCQWCEDGRVLVEGTGRDFGWWFEVCRGCNGGNS